MYEKHVHFKSAQLSANMTSDHIAALTVLCHIWPNFSSPNPKSPSVKIWVRSRSRSRFSAIWIRWNGIQRDELEPVFHT